jgi:hypothetical protein
MENLFALTILKVLRLDFHSTQGRNPNHFGFQNRKGNTIYVSNMNGKITVSAFKVSKRCCNIEIESESDIEIMADKIISTLKIEHL